MIRTRLWATAVRMRDPKVAVCVAHHVPQGLRNCVPMRDRTAIVTQTNELTCRSLYCTFDVVGRALPVERQSPALGEPTMPGSLSCRRVEGDFGLTSITQFCDTPKAERRFAGVSWPCIPEMPVLIDWNGRPELTLHSMTWWFSLIALPLTCFRTASLHGKRTFQLDRVVQHDTALTHLSFLSSSGGMRCSSP